METISNFLRNKVSADKNRYVTGNYDLDLTYVTERIIAMSFPAEGVESTYRNNVDDVANFFKENHGPDKFRIYNLSERKYTYSKFNDRVLDQYGWPDHHAPPITLLFQIVISIHEWLTSDTNHVVAVHCLAGKGRTGTVITAYFLYCGLFQKYEEALAFFASKRSYNNWGVTGPSQLRFLQYFEDILYRKTLPEPKALKLAYINLSKAPNFSVSYLSRQGGCAPYMHIYSRHNNAKKLIFSSENEHEDIKTYAPGTPIWFTIDCPVRSEVLVEIFHLTPFYRQEVVCRFEFHVGMVAKSVLTLQRSQIDEACTDKRFSPDFLIDLGFEPLPKYDASSTQAEIRLIEGFLDGWKPEDGSICFFNFDKYLRSKAEETKKKTHEQKGGWLTKQGHQFKTWKRRWFVLKDPTLAYFKKPRDLQPAGWIVLDDIVSIHPHSLYDNESKGISERKEAQDPYLKFWFEIKLVNTSYIISAETDSEMREWVDAIEYVKNIHSRTSQIEFEQDDILTSTNHLNPNQNPNLNQNPNSNNNNNIHQAPTSSSSNTPIGVRKSHGEDLNLIHFSTESGSQEQQQNLRKSSSGSTSSNTITKQPFNQHSSFTEIEESLTQIVDNLKILTDKDPEERVSQDWVTLSGEEINLDDSPAPSSSTKQTKSSSRLKLGQKKDVVDLPH